MKFSTCMLFLRQFLLKCAVFTQFIFCWFWIDLMVLFLCVWICLALVYLYLCPWLDSILQLGWHLTMDVSTEYDYIIFFTICLSLFSSTGSPTLKIIRNSHSYSCLYYQRALQSCPPIRVCPVRIVCHTKLASFGFSY